MDICAYYYYLLALVPLVYAILLYRAAFSRSSEQSLRLPPGPWQLPVIGSLHHLLGGQTHRALQSLSRHHGPLMLLKFGEVPVIVASTAEAAKEIMGTHDKIFCTRPLNSSLQVLQKHGLGIGFAPYGDYWRQMRKICFLELLSAKRISSFRQIREEEVTRFVGSIASAAESQQQPLLNMRKMLAVHMTDTTVHAILGSRFNEHATLLRYVEEGVRLIGGFSLPDLFPSSRLARILSRTLRDAEAYRDSLLAFLDRVIGEHLERRTSSREEVYQEDDLIDVLLRIQGDGTLQFPLTMNNIKLVIFDIFAGGSDTTETTLIWAMAELMRNPSVMARAQAEVRGAFAGQMKVTEEGLRGLSYMHCIIKETLRLHIPAPLLLPRQCQEDCKILGYDVPKGATVFINAWAIARDPECWDEPEAFLPERFCGDTARNFKGSNFEFTPFGAGRRICPGIQFALATIELALASLLFHFDWSLPDGVLPHQLDMTETFGVSARKKLDLMLRPTLSHSYSV